MSKLPADRRPLRERLHDLRDKFRGWKAEPDCTMHDQQLMDVFITDLAELDAALAEGDAPTGA